MSLYAVRENSLICCNYDNESVSCSIAKTFEYFTGTQLMEGEDANTRLIEIYGTETQFDREFPKYEIAELIPQSFKCEVCGADIRQRQSMTEFDIYSLDEDLMGTVYKYGLQDGMFTAGLLAEGHCPICEEWDDGTGNFCSTKGWGKNQFMFDEMHRIDRRPPEGSPENTAEPLRRFSRRSYLV